ncbi:hypothetical protein LEP1GSC075_0414 [Leptospira interrogans str. Kito]|nr:hypothetical protein LEP1GSC075_0414 [Leptospira interrogans str. Kito]
MANVLGVSRSGFYQFLKRSKNELEKYNPELVGIFFANSASAVKIIWYYFHASE